MWFWACKKTGKGESKKEGLSKVLQQTVSSSARTIGNINRPKISGVPGGKFNTWY